MSTASTGSGGIQVDLASTASPAGAVRRDRLFSIPNPHRERVTTLEDLALPEIRLSDFPVVQQWRDKLFTRDGRPEICDELPRLQTEFLRSAAAQALDPITRRAQCLGHIFAEKTPLVRAGDLLPGKTTTSFVGPVVYCDTIGLCIWPELTTVAQRRQNPFDIRPEVAARLNREIFPYWLNHHPVMDYARHAAYDSANFANRDRVKGGSEDPPLRKLAGETPKCQELMERVAFYLSDKATCVSHTVPDFERVLRHGLSGLRAQLEQDQAACQDEESRRFLGSVVTVFDAAMLYARHLAQAARQAGNTALAEVCQKVPAQPATTLQEALASIWICYHLLLQENSNFGFSLGRLDQLLQPYYLADIQAAAGDQEKRSVTRRAVELVCHFFLRCSDHVPLSTAGSETLFAGSGSNQALTVGGVKLENGRMVDAVNDMTYIILKATELLSIRDPNVHARYHKRIHGTPPVGAARDWVDPYLTRVCQVNMITRATPAIHGDAPVIESMADYYADHEGVTAEEALEDACDYASIGCIEQNSAGKHYGNTGSTLLALPAVLELALFGGKHRSDGVGPTDPNLLQGRSDYTTPPLGQIKTMDEFVRHFRFQLDQMARQVVQNNNYLGRAVEKERPCPFLSGLFTGPTNLPGGHGASFRDVAAGGAKYNSAGIAVIGLADVIDSFCVLDSLVFGGKMTATELLAAMSCNFTSHEERRNESRRQRLHDWLGDDKRADTLSEERMKEINRMIRLAPKYGAGVATSGTYDNSLAVSYTRRLTAMLHEVFYQYRTHRGGRYLVGYWSMTNHAGFGMLTQATPNGRPARQPFASGITPGPGIVKRNGDPVILLDHMSSVAAVDANTVKNGYTYNLSLTTRGPAEKEHDATLFGQAMTAFMGMDGVLAQMCVSSIADLQAADAAATAAEQEGAGEMEAKALDRYRDLMIRVAGYSAYYISLSSPMRREIIARANFGLAGGREQHAP